MPSWKDGESSDEWLPHLTPLDYAPDTTEEPAFQGIAGDTQQVCDGHGLKPRRCVAFAGVNIGRRFYMCSIENEVTNCGFVSWVDDEWPVQLQNALGKIWGMYNESVGQRIDESAELYDQLKELTAEKRKYEKKYCNLVSDVNKMMDEAEKRAVEKNLLKIKQSEDDEFAEMKR